MIPTGTADPTSGPVLPPAHVLWVADSSRPSGRSARIICRLTSLDLWVVVMYAALAAGFAMCFLQGDILYNSFVANKVASGHFDVYSWFSAHAALKKIDTVMPPLYYLVTAAYLKLLALVHLNPVASNPKFLFTNVFHSHMGIVVMLGLLLLKLPNLLAIGVGLVAVVRITRSISTIDRHVAIFLWLASPALIVSAVMQAQNDVIAAAITLVALLAFLSRRIAWFFLLLGIAACFKTYPLILVPPTALLLCGRDLIRAIRYGLISAIPLAFVSLPYLGGAYMSRVFGAHDGNTLLGASYTGRLPTHLWVLGYLIVLGVAWLRSSHDADVFEVVTIWFLPLCMVFILNWWVPQWTVWLLPAVILLAARDRLFAWLWVLANAAILADNVFNYPGNMDGGMLEPFYGDRNHPANSHFYNFHLFHIWQHVPYAVLDCAYILCGALFLALLIRGFQYFFGGSTLAWTDLTMPRIPSVYAAALAGPLLLVPYIGTMVGQRLAG